MNTPRAQQDKLGVDVINVKFLQKDAGKEMFISFFAKRTGIDGSLDVD